MRKVKVAAAFLALIGVGLAGSVKHGDAGLSVARTDQTLLIQELSAETVATAASIETTTHTTSTTRDTTVTTENETTGTEETDSTTASSDSSTTSASECDTTTFETTTTVPETLPVTESLTTTSECFTTLTTTLSTSETVIVTTTDAPSLCTYSDYGLTEREYIMLCNVVGHEYGSDFVPTAEKALVVEVIMNRVSSSMFPNTIYGVLTQKNQFSGLEYFIELDHFSYMVTDDVKAAVDLYFADVSQFQHGYLFFNGDGVRNYFRKTV